MDSIIQSQITIEYHSPEQVYRHGKRLEGMTFRDVLNLGIVPEGVTREYNSRRYKGGMGTLIEERFFGYKANSDRMADFAEAGVELKATCIDRRKNGSDVAGERMVLTMIPYDEEAPLSLYDSHLWHKCQKMLLVWYRRDKTIDTYDQRIEHVLLFTPPVEILPFGLQPKRDAPLWLASRGTARCLPPRKPVAPSRTTGIMPLVPAKPAPA